MYNDRFYVDQTRYMICHVQKDFQTGYPTAEEHEPKSFKMMIINFEKIQDIEKESLQMFPSKLLQIVVVLFFIIKIS